MAVPPRVSLLILHTQVESGAYSRDSSRCPRRRPFIYLIRHTPSGQSRAYRVTQLRTDGVHCRKSAGTGPAVLKVVRVTRAAFVSSWTNYYCASLFSHTHYWYKGSIFEYKILVHLLYCFMDTFSPSDLCLYKSKESSVHCTISSVVCQNIISSVLLLYCGPVSPRLTSV